MSRVLQSFIAAMYRIAHYPWGLDEVSLHVLNPLILFADYDS